MIRHLVHLRYKADAGPNTKLSLYEKLASLSGHIDGILDFQYRENVSIETDLVRDFKDMFWFDFRDVSVRDAYLVDKAHKQIGGELVAELEGGADGVFVCDIEL